MTVAACPCADISSSTDPKAQAFVKDYTAKFGSGPGIYSAEAWDIAQMYISAFKAGKTTRQAITDYFHSLKAFPGLTKNYTFQPSGELDPSAVQIYFYQDKSQAWSFLGRSDQVLTG